MNTLPNDPMMLLSVINTKLRDEYSDLCALCEDMNADCDALKEKLSAAGYAYNAGKNRFE